MVDMWFVFDVVDEVDEVIHDVRDAHDVRDVHDARDIHDWCGWLAIRNNIL